MANILQIEINSLLINSGINYILLKQIIYNSTQYYYCIHQFRITPLDLDIGLSKVFRRAQLPIQQVSLLHNTNVVWKKSKMLYNLISLCHTKVARTKLNMFTCLKDSCIWFEIQSFPWLIDFNGISTWLGLFYVQRLRNHIHYMSICTFFV